MLVNEVSSVRCRAAAVSRRRLSVVLWSKLLRFLLLLFSLFMLFLLIIEMLLIRFPLLVVAVVLVVVAAVAALLQLALQPLLCFLRLCRTMFTPWCDTIVPAFRGNLAERETACKLAAGSSFPEIPHIQSASVSNSFMIGPVSSPRTCCEDVTEIFRLVTTFSVNSGQSWLLPQDFYCTL